MQTELGGNEAMTCQELLALSGALSAALPTGQLALDSFLNSLTKGKYPTRNASDTSERIRAGF
jgi:voltage-dependent calcium channel T type alpha-1G